MLCPMASIVLCSSAFSRLYEPRLPRRKSRYITDVLGDPQFYLPCNDDVCTLSNLVCLVGKTVMFTTGIMC